MTPSFIKEDLILAKLFGSLGVLGTTQPTLPSGIWSWYKNQQPLDSNFS
ncbi:hypothetical protein GO755_31400 [Spirosoma sp. HMF4905]|uniref:Uncharacterized protein n=1 Tax=Spirosoma arboris TaxID=2682092 RepID=A0A7K1SL98_9BACT|nr:hypothetical protein [Spirosoma arboris]MVM34577.1 hypothetical protein [Spirosoma arboris]